MQSLPRIDWRYWLVLMAASVFGTNTGDFVADYLHIGHLLGLPWLVGLLILILLCDRFLPLRPPLWFWAAIITVRTAATNIGDGFHDVNVGFGVSLPLVSLLFAGAVALYTARGGGVREDGTVTVDWVYWLCMILAGAWGTIAGDFASFGLTHPPLFPAMATLVTSVPLVLGFLGGLRGRLLHPYYYWVVVGLIRCAGTCAGDALAHLIGGGQDVLPSTIVTGATFAGLVLALYVIAPDRRSAVRTANA